MMDQSTPICLASAPVPSEIEEVDIKISGHRPNSFTELTDGSYCLVTSMNEKDQRHALELAGALATEVEHWSTDDPSVTDGSREVRIVAYRGALTARIRKRLVFSDLGLRPVKGQTSQSMLTG